MYATEKLENFRWISKLMATYSNYTLTSIDLVPNALYQELAELGGVSFMIFLQKVVLLRPRSICRNSL